MIDDATTVAGILMKYGFLLATIAFGIAMLSSLIKALRDEPVTFFKSWFVALVPFAAALGIPYFLLYEQFHWPFLLNVIAGAVIYAVVLDFVDKRVDVSNKDER